MARGWESKSVESQIEDRRDAPRGPGDNRQKAEDRDREQKRAGLETSRRRIAHELEKSHSETHRAALENALSFLDEQLKNL